MSFKKQKWESYQIKRKGNILTIIIRDETGKQIDELRGSSSKDYSIIGKILKHKYDIDLSYEKGFLDKDWEW